MKLSRLLDQPYLTLPDIPNRPTSSIPSLVESPAEILVDQVLAYLYSKEDLPQIYINDNFIGSRASLQEACDNNILEIEKELLKRIFLYYRFNYWMKQIPPQTTRVQKIFENYSLYEKLRQIDMPQYESDRNVYILFQELERLYPLNPTAKANKRDMIGKEKARLLIGISLVFGIMMISLLGMPGMIASGSLLFGLAFYQVSKNQRPVSK